ncbi:uncharacterized protein BDW70DRAFT_127193 [Aspergillus foveolatus]|uniref:uncharacterized protein n=1 Tax=Aspergillus foveolatus TaxID=210207 RepID=UPI003CCE5200
MTRRKSIARPESKVISRKSSNKRRSRASSVCRKPSTFRSISAYSKLHKRLDSTEPCGIPLRWRKYFLPILTRLFRMCSLRMSSRPSPLYSFCAIVSTKTVFLRPTTLPLVIASARCSGLPTGPTLWRYFDHVLRCCGFRSGHMLSNSLASLISTYFIQW